MGKGRGQSDPYRRMSGTAIAIQRNQVGEAPAHGSVRGNCLGLLCQPGVGACLVHPLMSAFASCCVGDRQCGIWFQ